MLRSKKEQSISYYQFLILRYIEEKGEVIFDIRKFADDLGVSWKVIEIEIDNTRKGGLVEFKNNNENKTVLITSSGLEALEPYRVKNAVILAAGFGSRLMPATENRPKPLVKVNGVRFIDTLIDAFISRGITNITVVRGYKKEFFRELIQKYPFINFVDNDNYAEYNNVLSAMLGLEHVEGGTYISDGDFLLTNPDIIKKYQYHNCALGAFVSETDDWCFRMDEYGCVCNYQKGNTNCFNSYLIDYFTPLSVAKLKDDLADYWIGGAKDDSDCFWEFIPLLKKSNEYKMYVCPCKKSDVMEVDNYYELKMLDSSYE